MIYWLYEYLLKRQITDLPGHVCFMISGQDMADAPEKLALITSWCNELSEFVLKRNPSARKGIQGLTFHISAPVPEELNRYLPEVRKIGTISHLILHIGDKEETAGEGHGCCRCDWKQRKRGNYCVYPQDGAGSYATGKC